MTINLDKLLTVARTVAKAVVPGAPATLAAGEAIFDFARSIRPTLSEADQAKLAEGLEPLLAVMNRDVDQALRDLRGE